MKLSILIPSRNEIFLQKTIDDLQEHIEDDTEIIVGLDGWTIPINKEWQPKFPERIKWIIETEGIGQRAMTNKLAKMSEAEYIMKIDAHCSFSQGFDVELLSKIDDKTIMAPYLLKLNPDWSIIHKPANSAYCFDTNLVFQYNREAENKELLNETMCLQGSAWVISRKNYWDWNICEESLGNWGGQAAELGIKAYLNGGRCITNKNCYYAHLFREKEEEFPYQRNKEIIKETLAELRERYLNKKLAGLIEKFNYPCDWTKEFVANLK